MASQGGPYNCPQCGAIHGGGPAGGDLCSACSYPATPKESFQKQKRPFIEFTRTKKIEVQLTRIATALEQLLIEAYNFHTDIPTTDTSGRDPEVMYTDHDEQDIQDIVDDMKDRQ